MLCKEGAILKKVYIYYYRYCRGRIFLMKKIILFILITAVLFLAACSGDSVTNTMYEHLEKSVELEEPFIESQQQLISLDSKEQEIYGQLIELSADEMDKVNELADEAITTINERKEILAEELTIMSEANEEFSNVKELVEKLKEDDQIEKAEKLVNTMEKRYATFKELNEISVSSLDENEKLYQLFKNEELTEEELKEQITAVNEVYDQETELSNNFNQLTEQYNQEKREFYESTDLNIVF